MIARGLLSSAEATLAALQVKQVVIGLAYTGVMLSDGSCGLAAILNERSGCKVLHMTGTMTGQPALDLAHGLLSADPLLSALGLATINAALTANLPLSSSSFRALPLSTKP